MTYDAMAGGWALSASAMAAGDSASLSCGDEVFARVFADEGGVHAAVITRWDGAKKRFGSDEPLVFALDAPDQWGGARLEWRVSGVRLYVDGALCDEDWPLGGFPMDGAWTLESNRPAVLEAHESFQEDAETAFDGSAQYFTLPGHNTSIGDCMPFEYGSEYHLFCLYDRRHHGSKKHLGAHQWAHLSTKDLRRWTLHPVALGIDAQWEGSICTGSMIEKDGRVYAFYAVRMADGLPARLTWAESDDCVHFKKSGRYFELTAPYEPTSARDPKVWRGEDGLYHMMVTTSLVDMERRSGCLAHLVSENLTDWTQREPMLVPGLDDQPECSDYFKLNDLYYLVYSNQLTARYVVSDKPFGPWRRLREDVLDCPGCRVPKTAMLNGRRLLTGWATEGPWGGRVVTHELIVRADGTLGARFIDGILPDSVQDASIAPARIEAPLGSGSAHLGDADGAFRLKLTLSPKSENMAFGLDVTGEGDRVRIEFDSAYETTMLMRGGDNVRSAPRGNLLTQCGWCGASFDVTVIVCNGVAEFQLPGDHVLLTGCTLSPPYAIDAYARGDMDIQPK